MDLDFRRKIKSRFYWFDEVFLFVGDADDESSVIIFIYLNLSKRLKWRVNLFRTSLLSGFLYLFPDYDQEPLISMQFSDRSSIRLLTLVKN